MPPLFTLSAVTTVAVGLALVFLAATVDAQIAKQMRGLPPEVYDIFRLASGFGESGYLFFWTALTMIVSLYLADRQTSEEPAPASTCWPDGLFICSRFWLYRVSLRRFSSAWGAPGRVFSTMAGRFSSIRSVFRRDGRVSPQVTRLRLLPLPWRWAISCRDGAMRCWDSPLSSAFPGLCWERTIAATSSPAPASVSPRRLFCNGCLRSGPSFLLPTAAASRCGDGA